LTNAISEWRLLEGACDTFPPASNNMGMWSMKKMFSNFFDTKFWMGACSNE
jgi:hypothetical protein